MNKQRIFAIVIFLSGIFGLETALADVDTRQKVIELLTSVGLSEELNAGVKISTDEAGVVCIADEGKFFMQYMVVEPNVSADANLIVDPNLKIPATADKIVITTHGFVDKAKNDWPDDLAKAIRKKVDPNQWLCGFFDWRGGAAVVSPVDAAKYGRDIAGPRLAKAILKLKQNPAHVHLIAHSAGCWTINSAAKIIADQTDARIHLTFLDAYVPPFWNEADFGGIESRNTVWAEHYYTKDLTLGSTQKNLTYAHNVNITGIDTSIKEHKFPYRWYYATVTDKFSSFWEEGNEVLTKHKGLDYGFARSDEAGSGNFKKSLTLKKGNNAVEIKNPKKRKFFGLKLFKKKKGKANE